MATWNRRGNALAEILWGQYNPSGRLSMSFPETVGQVPIFYNVDNTGRPYESAPEEKYVSKYLDVSNYAKYPFGFGLSYSHFSYQPIQLSALTFTKEQPVTVSVLVRNDSPIAGEETVQFYVRDLVGQVVRPIKELKDFQKVWLEPKEEKEVQFLLSEDMVRYVHSDNQVTSDAGEFIVMIGGNSRDVQTATVTLNE